MNNLELINNYIQKEQSERDKVDNTLFNTIADNVSKDLKYIMPNDEELDKYTKNKLLSEGYYVFGIPPNKTIISVFKGAYLYYDKYINPEYYGEYNKSVDKLYNFECNVVYSPGDYLKPNKAYWVLP